MENMAKSLNVKVTLNEGLISSKGNKYNNVVFTFANGMSYSAFIRDNELVILKQYITDYKG